jgi:phage tail-like protein
MAENKWGKSPPKGKSSITPGMIKDSFWGPAEVPDQVRGTPRVTTWGGPRPWEEGEAVESIEGGEHDSWVDEVKKDDSAEYEFTGTDLDLEGSTYTADGKKPGKADPNKPNVREQKPGEGAPLEVNVREQGPGEHDSWVGGEPKKGGESSFEGTDLELSSFRAEVLDKDLGGSDFTPTDLDLTSSTYEGEATEAGKGDPNKPEVREQLPGQGEALDVFVREQGPGEGVPLDVFVREQKPGEHDSWVDDVVDDEDPGFEYVPVLKGDFALYDFNSKDLNLQNQTWVDGLVRLQGAGKRGAHNPFVREVEAKKTTKERDEVPDKDIKSSDPYYNSFLLDPEMQFKEVESKEFDAPLPQFDAPSGGGSFQLNGGYATSASSSEHLDPFVGGWNFLVKIDNIPEPHSKFVSISGLTMETENIEFKYGEDAYMRRIPGKEKFGEVELTRIYQMGSSGFAQWRNRIAQGTDDRRDVTIQVYHTTFETKVMEIKLMDAFISKWESPELNAGSSDGATEKITLVPHHVIINDGESSIKPSSQSTTMGADAGTPPPAPLSLEDYYAQVQAALDAAMGRMGTQKDLEDSRSRQDDLEKQRAEQAEKAAEFRKKQKEERAESSVREKLKEDLKKGREKRSEMNKNAEKQAELADNAKSESPE